MRKIFCRSQALFLVFILCVLSGCTASEGYQTYKIKKDVEKYLYQKYKEKFVAEVCWYDEELSRNYNILASPQNNNELKFKVLHGIWNGEGGGGYVDFYYNELYKNEINQYIQEMIAPYILDNQIEVNIYALKSKEISQKTFEDKENIIIMIKDDHKLDTDHIIDASKELHSKLPLIKRVHFYFASDNERYFNVEFESQYFNIRNNKLRERVDY